MKKLFGKIILAVLTVVMAFAAIGCGGNPDPEGPSGHTHTYVDGKCSDTTCGQYELFNAVTNDVMANFTLTIAVEKDTKNTSPDGSHVYGPEAGTRTTKESHIIKIADGKFYEQYIIKDYYTEEVIDEATKTFTGSDAETLIKSVVSQIRGYAFYEKFYDGQNMFNSTAQGYVLKQNFGFSYNGYYYNLTSGEIEVRNNSSVDVSKDSVVIKTVDGKISQINFSSKENCSDAQKSWYIETYFAVYTFSDYGTTVIA